MIALLEQPSGIYARQIIELADIPPKSVHLLFQRLTKKGYVSASKDLQPKYALTRRGRILAKALAAAIAEMGRK